MTFTLQVQFSGLCFHVSHPERPEVAVLMPDARFNESPIVTGLHQDNTPSLPHVGYLRINLANVPITDVANPIPPGTRPDGPDFEIVYRFRRQQLDFGIPPVTTAVTGNSGLPSLAAIAPVLRLRQDLFINPVPPSTPLLFRTRLHGGALAPSTDLALDEEKWRMDALGGGTGLTAESIPGSVVWTREVDADDLTLTITDFDGASPPVKLRLVPTAGANGPIIPLTFANLCSDNPLEWDTYETKGITGGEDSDFKWFYELFEPVTGTYEELLNGFVLPAPRLMSQPQLLQHFGGVAGDCGSAETQEMFPPF